MKELSAHRLSARRFAVTLGLLTSVLACSRSPANSNQAPTTASAPTDSNQGSTAASDELAEGGPAPNFAATAHTGQKVSLETLRGKVVVLYFYPKDGTPGCTVEAEQFRDQHTSFQDKNAVVLGVSSDGNNSHEDFAKDLGLPFLLLPDEDGAIRKAYRVGSFLGFASRVTFLIDRNGRIAKIYSKVDPKVHAKEVLRDMEGL